MRKDGFAGPRIVGWRVSRGQKRLALRGLAKAYRREERLHPEVVVLAPAIERMMMALGTGDANAEKDLRDRACRVAGPGNNLVEGDGANLVQRSFGGKQLTR